MKRQMKNEYLTCVKCHAKVYEYPSKFKKGEVVFWCPKCKEAGKSPYYQIADVNLK